ncbi:hypothetical protein JCM6882_003318 [Rhodosporidiobolus microsporus]
MSWCCCLTGSQDDQDYYQPLAMGPTPSSHHLILVRDKGRAAALSRTQDGVHVVKVRSASSTRTIPFLALLSASSSSSLDHSAPHSSPPHPTVTLSALVPATRKNDPNAPTKLWTLKGRVVEVNYPPIDEGGMGEAEVGQEEAKHKALEAWCKEIEKRAYASVDRRRRRLHCIVNPAGGKGKAKRVWEEVVRPVFEAADVSFDVSYTGPPSSPTNAAALARSHDPAAYDALVALSGDGIVHELLNGLATHSSGKGGDVLRRTPVVHVPCGSGNALATSLMGPEKVLDCRWAALAALKGNPIPLDLCSLIQPSSGDGNRLFSFLSQAFGLMADLDLGTEHLRWMGDARFTYGYIRGALSRVAYPCTVSVLLPSARSSGLHAPTKSAIAKAHNASLSPAAAKAKPDDAAKATSDGALPPLLHGSFSALSSSLPDGPRWKNHLPSQDELERLGEVTGEGHEWVHFEMEEKGVFFLYGGKVPFISRDVMMFPAADPNDGLLDLAIVEPMGPIEALTAMDGADRGALLSNPRVLYLKALAYRVTFPPQKEGGGCLSIDGEAVPYEGWQVECHRGVGRVMSLEGRWEGRRRVEGFD